MGALAWIGYALFCVASVVVGARLLRLWHGTRQRPELLAALALIGIGPLGFGLTTASVPIHGLSPLLGDAAWAFAAASLALGVGAVFLFTAEVFHPPGSGARTVGWMACGLSAGLWVAEAGTRGFPADEPGGLPVRLADGLRTLGLLWGSLAALRYRTRLRRSLALGIGDAGALARISLWSVALGAAGVASGVDAVAKLLTEARDVPLVKLTDAVLGTIAAFCLWSAFRARGSPSAEPASGAISAP